VYSSILSLAVSGVVKRTMIHPGRTCGAHPLPHTLDNVFTAGEAAAKELRGLDCPHDDLPDLLPPRRNERPLWLRAIYFGAGIILMILGFVGWVIPIVTGIPFYIAGIVCLSLASTRVREWINRAERCLSHENRRRLRHWIRKVPSKTIRAHIQEGPVESRERVEMSVAGKEKTGVGAGEGRR
jgi:hypothetical protein